MSEESSAVSPNLVRPSKPKPEECEGNLKRYSGSRMAQRWLEAMLLHCEQGFKRVKGYAAIRTVAAAIEAEQAESRKLRSAA